MTEYKNREKVLTEKMRKHKGKKDILSKGKWMEGNNTQGKKKGGGIRKGGKKIRNNHQYARKREYNIDTSS